MGMLKEFKEFAVKGNMIDMAVGIIIGGAFGKIVSSLVNDVLMPPLGMLMGGVDFADKVITLKEAAEDARLFSSNTECSSTRRSTSLSWPLRSS